MQLEDIESYQRNQKKIKIGLVPIITKNCSNEKKTKIKIKLFQLMQKFDGKWSFEMLMGDKKIEKYFEYLEKVYFLFYE